MGIYAKMLTGSNGDAGLTFLAFICGSMLAPVAGVIVDRVRRRTLLIWANLGAAAEVCLLLLAGPHRAWVIYPVMFGYGAAGSLILAAQTALLPAMVPDELLGDANTVLQVAEQGFRIFTPLIGAGMLAWIGPQSVILLDAGTFLVAAAALIAIRLREPKPTRSGEHWRAEFTAGIRFINGTLLLRRLLTSGIIALLVFGIFQSVQYAVVATGLHRSPPFLGVLEAAAGFGAVAGGVAAGALMDRFGERGLVVGGLAAMAIAFAPLLMTGQLAVVLVGMGLFGGGLLSVNIGAITLIQRNTPSELLGRVDSAVNLAILVPQAGSIAVGAVLVSFVDYRLLLLFMGVGIAVSALRMRAVLPRAETVSPTQRPSTVGVAEAPTEGYDG
jgi:MFS family permease